MDTNKAATEPEIGPEIETTKQLAALRQLTTAIEHLRKREYECAITLAAAAEGLLPPTDEPHIFSDLKEFISPEEFKYLDFRCGRQLAQTLQASRSRSVFNPGV